MFGNPKTLKPKPHQRHPRSQVQPSRCQLCLHWRTGFSRLMQGPLFWLSWVSSGHPFFWGGDAISGPEEAGAYIFRAPPPHIQYWSHRVTANSGPVLVPQTTSKLRAEKLESDPAPTKSTEILYNTFKRLPQGTLNPKPETLNPKA